MERSATEARAAGNAVLLRRDRRMVIVLVRRLHSRVEHWRGPERFQAQRSADFWRDQAAPPEPADAGVLAPRLASYAWAGRAHRSPRPRGLLTPGPPNRGGLDSAHSGYNAEA